MPHAKRNNRASTKRARGHLTRTAEANKMLGGNGLSEKLSRLKTSRAPPSPPSCRRAPERRQPQTLPQWRATSRTRRGENRKQVRRRSRSALQHLWSSDNTFLLSRRKRQHARKRTVEATYLNSLTWYLDLIAISYFISELPCKLARFINVS